MAIERIRVESLTTFMHLLIPYIYLRNEEDPNFHEFTYGDINWRGRKLQRDVKPGEYIFFHTSIGGKKYITAYFVVDRVFPTSEACRNKMINDKFNNPHMVKWRTGSRSENDVIVFGDPITSRLLDKPLLFDRRLSRKLSFCIAFPKGRTETQAIGSATRQWRKLFDRDIAILLSEISRLSRKPSKLSKLRSIDEVTQVIEKDIENHIAANSSLIGPGLKLKTRQEHTDAGRSDLIFEDRKRNLTVVELKLYRIGREAIQQVARYMRELRKQHPKKRVEGVVVCSGLMPAYEDDLRKQKKVRTHLINASRV